MKKTGILLAILLILASCKFFMQDFSLEPETGTLGLSMCFQNDSRSVVPSSIPVSYYYITFFRDSFSQDPINTENGSYSVELPVGSWNISVEARNSEDKTIASGTSNNVQINADSNTNISINLNPLSSGTGKVKLSVSWPQTFNEGASPPDYTGINAVMILLDNNLVDSENYSFDSTNLTWEQELAAGDYKGKIYLKKGGVNIVQLNESIQIYGNLISEKTISLSVTDLNRAPRKPSDLTLTPGIGQIILNWTDNSPVEEGYTVERSPDGNNWYVLDNSLDPNTQSYIDTGLNQNTDYYYHVAAFNDLGRSYCEAVSGQTTPVYTIVYSDSGADSGSAPNDPVIYGVGDTVTLKDNTGGLAKFGFGFDGWNTEENGSGSHYAAGASIPMESGGITLYPEWSVNVEMKDIITLSDIPVVCSLQGGNDNVTMTRPFKMGVYEITQAQYTAVTGNSKAWTEGEGKGDKFPAYYINWYEACDFCNKLSSQEGLTAVYYSDPSFTDSYDASDMDTIYWNLSADGYRLPTESEWEYAGRGGITGTNTVYAGSNTIDNVAWYSGNSNSSVHEAGTLAPNEFGQYDMSGNVWEWCWDWWITPYSAGTDPEGPASGPNRNIRGGSRSDTLITGYLELANRTPQDQDSELNNYGFRIVQQIPRVAVSYHANGAAGSVPASNYLGADEVVSANTGPLYMTNRIFDGWNTSSDGTGTPYKAGETLSVTGQSVTLYAQWKVFNGPEMVEILQTGDVPVTCSLQGSDGNIILTRPYSISKYEITQAQYTAVMESVQTWESLRGLGQDFPAYYIDWYDACEFCNKLSQMASRTEVYYSDAGLTVPYTADKLDSIYQAPDKNGYRLPTEAEWEYAARGGKSASDTIYAGSDTIGNVAWYSGNKNGSTRAVGTRDANECGLYDMSGNVWEWCWGWYETPFGTGGLLDPEGASSGTTRTMRGGCFYDADIYNALSNSANRVGRAADYNTSYGVGLRVVLQNPNAASGYLFYLSNGAESGSVPLASVYSNGDVITVEGNTGNLVRPGYNFTGWNTSPDGSGTSYAAGSTITMNSSNIALYAQWDSNFESLNLYMSPVITSGEIPVTGTLQGGTVTVSLKRAFKMSEFEITQHQYESVMGRSENWTSEYGKGDDYPAYYVDWWEAAEFCNRLSSLDERTAAYYSDSGFTDIYEASDENNIHWKTDADGYRLPTESEWEYAARGASDASSSLYAGSDTINNVAWYSGNSGNTVHQYGLKNPNGCGFFDMSGNVWEWCWDWYESELGASGTVDPEGPTGGSSRVLRGGSWYNAPEFCTVSKRGDSAPDKIDNGYGFRIVSP